MATTKNLATGRAAKPSRSWPAYHYSTAQQFVKAIHLLPVLLMRTMFNQYQPNVKATIEFLSLLKVKVNAGTVNETMQNHPDWPSLLCISDSLNIWNIPNAAGKIDPAKIDELPTPFVACTNDRKAPLALVKNITKSSIEYRQNNYSKSVSKNKLEFIKNWEGIYLIAETDEHSGEPDIEKIKRNNLVSSLTPIAAITAFISAFILLLFFDIEKAVYANAVLSTGIYLQCIILLTGVIVSTLLLCYEIDKNSPLLQKICTGLPHGNCNAILTSKSAKVFTWLSWSEIGFFYFAGALLCLFFTGTNILATVSLLAVFNILAIPYPFFSVFYQWKVAKQWCVLCLIIQAFLAFGVINVFATNLLGSYSAITVYLLAQTFFLYLIPALIWFTIKPYFIKLQKAKNTNKEYLRIKFNPAIFETLLKKQKQITIPPDGLGIDLGKSSARNIVIKVCNPYCGPCAKAHPEIETLINEVSNVKGKIIFTTPNIDAHPSIKRTRHLMAIAASENAIKTQEALSDWYNSRKKNYEAFAIKYPLNGGLHLQNHKIEAMDKWCTDMRIEFTPTIFINGYQMPDVYDTKDLRYFLSE